MNKEWLKKNGWNLFMSIALCFIGIQVFLHDSLYRPTYGATVYFGPYHEVIGIFIFLIGAYFLAKIIKRMSK